MIIRSVLFSSMPNLVGYIKDIASKLFPDSVWWDALEAPGPDLLSDAVQAANDKVLASGRSDLAKGKVCVPRAYFEYPEDILDGAELFYESSDGQTSIAVVEVISDYSDIIEDWRVLVFGDEESLAALTPQVVEEDAWQTQLSALRG